MIIRKIKAIFKDQDERTKKAQRNIIYSFLIKGVSILTYLLLVPITLRFLNPVEYGIWLTLSSILMWINTFDVGLGNGLRNKLTEAFATGNTELAKKYVSTTYVMLSFIIIPLFVSFYVVNRFLDWPAILNVDKNLIPNLGNVVLISFGLFCITFVLKLIGNIYLALQKPAINNFLVMLGQLISLIFIYLLSFIKKGDLLTVAIIYSSSPVVVYLVSYPLTFRNEIKYLFPKFKHFDQKYIKDLLGLGGKFFLLQIAGLIIFSTSNLIISNKFGPENVTIYNIAYRYFSIIPMLFSIVLTPIWSATTDAYVRKDFLWIKSSMKTVNLLLMLTLGLLFLMVVFSNFLYQIWIGDAIFVPFVLTAFMAVYTYLIVASLSYSSFLNGIGKLRVQVINTCIVALLFLPLAFFLSDIYGMLGLILALILVNLSGVALNWIQFSKIVDGRAVGIWNR